jgi:hypothetical protein
MEPLRIHRRTLSAGLIAILSATSSLRAEGPSFGANQVVAGQTKVLLLQPIDATVDSAVLHPARQRTIRLGQQYEFISRGFVVLGEGMAGKAASSQPPIDLEGNGDGRTAETLDKLARRAGADWAVSIVVREIKTDPSEGSDFKVHSTLFVQIWDAHRHAWLAQLPYVGHLAAGGSPGWLFIKSLDSATGEALTEMLAVYSPSVTVSRDGSIVDYLAGQSAPFVGDPASPFHGLNVDGEVRP